MDKAERACATVQMEFADKLKAFNDRIEGQENRIIRLQRRADTQPPRTSDLDWEAQQVAFLNDPENFKEGN